MSDEPVPVRAAADPATGTPRSPRRRRLRRFGAAAGVLLVLYTAFGFLAAPPLLRRVLVKRASEALHRDVAVARVRVNPLVLSIAVEGLEVRHRDGSPFVAWDSLYLRLAPLRLLTWDVGLAEVRLVRASVHVGLDPEGALSFQDLLPPEGPPEAAEPPPEKEGGLGLSIGRLAVEEARVVFRDATRRPAFESALGPLTIRLESFRTKGGGDSPYSFVGTTDAGETFRWTGTVRSRPLRSKGTLAFERIALPRYAPYFQDEVPIALQDGLLDLETRYELEWGANRRVLQTSEGRAAVDRLAMGPRGAADPAVRLPRIEVTGIGLDALARRAAVAEVAVRGGALRVLRQADGSLELARMAPPPSPSPSPSRWSWSVGAVAVSGLALSLEDRTPPRPVLLPLTDIQLRLEPLGSGAEVTSALALSLAWSGQGRLAVRGTLQAIAGKAALDLEASGLDLVPLAPYLQPRIAARLSGGRAGARVKVGIDASGPALRWTLAGDVRVDAVAFAERGNEDLLRWRALEVSGIDAASASRRATVRLVRLVEPQLKAYVWEDGASSLARALGAPAAPEPPPAPGGAGWRTAIGAVQIVRGRAAFVDRSVTPPAVLNVTGADARVTSLSSDPRVRSTVDVQLELEGASPVRVAGTLNPLQKEGYAELAIASQGVDLSPLDPYSGKFLGYRVQKGKLDLDLRYRVENRKLAASNVVKVNQLTLGEATDSPDATKMPVRLALALLQDKEGIILLDVPVEGELDDPDFHLGKVIWRAILNLLVKVATSPFSALAALVGSDKADLSMAEFAPGTAELLPAAREGIALLARSLDQRPALGLEMEGSADASLDGPALRRAALERSLRRARAAALKLPPAAADEVALAPEERARLVRAAYDAAFPPTPPKQGEAAPPPLAPQEMEERLAAAQQVPPDAYRSLAAERAQRVREALLAAGLDQARLFLAQGGRAEKEKGARVYFTVR